MSQIEKLKGLFKKENKKLAWQQQLIKQNLIRTPQGYNEGDGNVDRVSTRYQNKTE